MISMVIMAIISAAILGTASSAMENARRSRTRSLVAKISGLVLERWDSYANRRVDINPDILEEIDTWANEPSLTPLERSQRNVSRGQILSDARLIARRELMKLEMPDRWSDITGNAVGQSIIDPQIVPPLAPPALTRTYLRKYQEALGNSDEETVQLHQGAECLYMTVMFACGDGEARTLFSSQDIGDFDGDGAPEFLDGWGQPISWLRCAPGFVSSLQPLNPDGSRPFDLDHDPFDIYRRDLPTVTTPNLDLYPARLRPHVASMRTSLGAYRLVPLIYSAGPDNSSDVSSNPSALTGTDPYFAPGTTPVLLGTAYDVDEDGEDSSRDNIHNHLIEY